MGCRWKRIVKPIKSFEIFFSFRPHLVPRDPAKESPGPLKTNFFQTNYKLADLGKPTFFKLSKSWHVGCPQKRLLKPVKNFEENFSFDFTQSPGTPLKGPPDL